MSDEFRDLPDEYPDYLKYKDADAPVPTWEQVTRSADSFNPYMTSNMSRIIVGTEDTEGARDLWNLWPTNYRRSIALLIDKIYNEGWLDSVGKIVSPWDGGWYFYSRETEQGSLADILNSKAGADGTYTRSTIREGLFAFLNSWNHKDWRESWMENDEGMAAIHVGIFENNMVEVHFEAFNPLFIKGASGSDVIDIPLLGAFNYRYFQLHRRWEQSEFAKYVRRSANFYFMMRDKVPLCF
jgi:hypothetical protein